MKPEVLLVDLSNLYWTSWHVTKDSPMSEAGSLTSAAVRRAVGMCEPGTLVAICCDVGRSFRKELAPDYKANRPEKDMAALGELDKVKETLARDGYWLVGAPGFEADDVIATLAHEAAKREHRICIASADKDLLQLLELADSRMIRTYNAWEEWRTPRVIEKFGIGPDGLRDWLAFVGDSSDNIAGVPSIGPKTATELLLKHFSFEEIYAKIDALQVINGQVETKTPAAKAIGTPAVVEKLWRHRADATLARQLVTLRLDAPVKFDDIYTERRPMTTTTPDNVNLDDDGGEVISAPPPKETKGAGAEPGLVTDSDASSIPGGADGANQTSSATVPTQGDTPAPGPSRPETALVVATDVTYEHALEPRTGQQALTLGQVLYDSRAYSRFPTPQAITATVMRGRELGISALASLDAFHFAADMGQILPSWQVIVTLAEQSPDCEWFRWVGGDEKAQTWETKHRKHPSPTSLTYKIEQAERAQLVKTDKPKSAWVARPDEMLRKTAACQLARAVYPGATLGLYAPEEMGVEV